MTAATAKLALRPPGASAANRLVEWRRRSRWVLTSETSGTLPTIVCTLPPQPLPLERVRVTDRPRPRMPESSLPLPI